MEVKTVKLSDLIKSEEISMTYRASDRNPHMEGRDHMDNWRVTLRCNRSRMTLYFSKGSGHNGEPPTTEEVLDCLASDAAGLLNTSSFEDWCAQYGYDTDSRKAEKIFKAVESETERLRNLLGESLFETLLWNTERE